MTVVDDIVITSLAERPSLVPRIYDITHTWPEFIAHDQVGAALLHQVPGEFPDHCVVATDGERVVARGLSVPFDAHGDGRVPTPDTGWDQVLVWAFRDRRRGCPTTAAGALEITIDTEYLGRGLSYRMLAAMKDAVARQGHDVLMAPVRPNAKHREPRVALPDYVGRRRDDGLPADPWLRVHVKAGGSIVRIAPASMTVGGSLAQWREWTGLPFTEDGPVEVPGALVPVHCDTAHDRAVYVEPNVWVRHEVEPTTA
ncbi:MULTISPECIES: N-acetyltransferase [Streptomyces]|uniref:N-acetyltransferase n=1 Tax=Streptomyces thermoviolaceus subsp. thermoviolaceus TaxID=66860 RepID=A0ABX0Z016_STRTL|nr:MULTISPECIES: N-acetyltransferase [Streptomyces]NJP16628.1 N-acetyltransferase [Streptomyces thermoviolaceus subsp. thermoviolaceus]RSS06860.1 N-acetyltransferase [Streptomyces sp. WAC00469]WTD46122.1 N-acetyltransferase [Streptomyces thermoviolaceus]